MREIEVEDAVRAVEELMGEDRKTGDGRREK
jgi:hypothetical protein